MIHFGILHATHRKEHTLTQCIAALNEAGAESIQVIPDNGTWGSFKNWNRAMGRLLATAKDGDSVCVLDDDFIVCRDALVRLACSPDADAVHVLFTVEQNIPHDLRSADGWVEAPVGWGSWGGGILMPVEVARRHVRHPFSRRHLAAFQTGRHIDAANFETLRYLGAKCLHHLPSLIDHVGGHSSTMGNDHSDGATRGYRFNEWIQ